MLSQFLCHCEQNIFKLSKYFHIWGQLGNEMVGKFHDCGVNIFHFCEHE